MNESTTVVPIKETPVSRLREAMRLEIRQCIEEVVWEEFEAALGAPRHERTDERRGYRHGRYERHLLTVGGGVRLTMPRARMAQPDGSRREWRSAVVPKYQRRCREIDEAILGCYLGGINTRRIRRSLAPLLGEKALSKSTISRIVARLKEHFDAWRRRALDAERYAVVFLDAMRLRVRLARRVLSVPVEAVVGVRPDGQKVLVALGIAPSESTGAWKAVVEDLARRGLAAPALVVADGNPGLLASIAAVWPGAPVQRCTKHKLENLLAKAPTHAHAELRRDYRAITQADSLAQAERAYTAFCRKWRALCASVVESLEEAGPHLLTFYRFPRSQWKSLRTTNPIERVNEEFRRRVKTQGSFSTEQAALVLLYGLIAAGQIRLNKIAGWREMPAVIATLNNAA
jgi:transposase-like protein